MEFEDMTEIQRRLHNAALVLDADGDEYGFVDLLRGAIAEIERTSRAVENSRYRNMVDSRISYHGFSYGMGSQWGIDSLRKAIEQNGDF